MQAASAFKAAILCSIHHAEVRREEPGLRHRAECVFVYQAHLGVGGLVSQQVLLRGDHGLEGPLLRLHHHGHAFPVTWASTWQESKASMAIKTLLGEAEDPCREAIS